MIYLIFTVEGWQEAKTFIIKDKAEVWINPSVLSNDDIATLHTANITFSILPTFADPSNEKSVSQALDYVEKKAPNAEILVEFI